MNHHHTWNLTDPTNFVIANYHYITIEFENSAHLSPIPVDESPHPLITTNFPIPPTIPPSPNSIFPQ